MAVSSNRRLGEEEMFKTGIYCSEIPLPTWFIQRMLLLVYWKRIILQSVTHILVRRRGNRLGGGLRLEMEKRRWVTPVKTTQTHWSTGVRITACWCARIVSYLGSTRNTMLSSRNRGGWQEYRSCISYLCLSVLGLLLSRTGWPPSCHPCRQSWGWLWRLADKLRLWVQLSYARSR